MISNFKVLGSILLFICLISLSSCHSKETPINRLTELTEDVKANYKTYSEEDWELFAEELEMIEQDLEQYIEEYTDEEKKEIGKLKGFCLGYATKYSVNNFKKNMENVVKEMEGIIEGFTDAFGEDVEN